MSLSKTIRKSIYRTLGFCKPKEIGAFILCYHSIGNSSWRHSINVNEFKRQIDYLEHKYNIISYKEIKEIVDGVSGNPFQPAVAINFDDGYKDILEVKNYLKSKGIKPVLFLLAGNITDKSELKNNLPFLTKEEVKALIADGWDIGSHGLTHRDFWQLTKDEIKKEIFESKSILENTYGIKIKYFSYPRGRYTPEIISMVKDAGYEMAGSMNDGNITRNTNPFLLPRIGVDKTHSFSEFKTLMLEPVVMFRKTVKNFAGGIIRNYL